MYATLPPKRQVLRSQRSDASFVSMRAVSAGEVLPRVIKSVSDLKLENDPVIPESFLEGDDLTDVVFQVEGRKLHFYKFPLISCSPVFKHMLTHLSEQGGHQEIPLPGKKYHDLAFFFMQMHPEYSVIPITGKISILIGSKCW